MLQLGFICRAQGFTLAQIHEHAGTDLVRTFLVALALFVGAPLSASARLLPDKCSVIVYHNLPPLPLARAAEIVVLDVAFEEVGDPNDYYALSSHR